MNLSQSQSELSVTLAPLGLPPRAAFDRLREMEFRFVQLSAAQDGLRPRDLDRSARRDLLASLRRREMRVSGIDLWIPPAHFLDESKTDKAVSAVREAIQFAADLDRCPVSLSFPGIAGGPGVDDAIVMTIASDAEKFGVALVDHAVPPIEHASIKVGLDPAAWLTAGEDPASIVSRFAQRLASARLCDLLTSGVRGPAADAHEGQLDVTAYRIALSLIQLASPVIIDTRQWTDPWRGIEQSRAAWQSAAVM